MTIIGCIVDPSIGQVSLDGKQVYGNRWLRGDLRRLRLDKIGFIFQADNLPPFLTATETVALVLQLAGKSRVQELLEYLEIGPRARAMPALLSGARTLSLFRTSSEFEILGRLHGRATPSLCGRRPRRCTG